MKIVEFLCFGGNEIANSARTIYYTRNLGGIPGLTLGDCACDAINEGYSSPVGDPSPWYEPSRPESAEFYGLYAHSITLEAVLSRKVDTASRHGSYLSPARYGGRQLQVSGTMLASSMEGMAYGERWIAEVLRGSPCNEGNCPTDDALILPACPDDPNDYDAGFRTLVNVGCTDGPIFSQMSDLPERSVQTVGFLLVSSQPWLYHPPTRCLDEVSLATPVSCGLTTPQWMGEGTFVIDITAESAVTDIVITGRVSLDGDCPVSDPGTSVMPSFTYTIPTMAVGDRLLIDGMRKQVHYFDASERYAKSALPYIEFVGPWIWPDVGTCTTMCLTIEAGTGDAVATVDTVLREL